jgi:hypothetical protein
VSTHYDVFNGDADGICALHQLRLEESRESVLVTGAKRDIALLARVEGKQGDSVTALDISASTNRDALIALLERGISVQYFDHHYAGELPQHPKLKASIDTSPQVCTGMIVDRYLEGKQRIWAAVAAFGDDLDGPARGLASSLGLHAARIESLRAVGQAIAYNAYGDSEGDLIVHPAELYRTVARYADPFKLLADEPMIAKIAAVRADDLARVEKLQPTMSLTCADVYLLPDAAWSRRVRGALGNELAKKTPERATAVLTPNAQGGYVVSVRAPRTKPTGADSLCRGFATGGGRAAAGGINNLPANQLDDFMRQLDAAFA